MRMASLRKKYQRARKRYGDLHVTGIRHRCMTMYLGNIIRFGRGEHFTKVVIREKD
jgi:hypothetical protein